MMYIRSFHLLPGKASVRPAGVPVDPAGRCGRFLGWVAGLMVICSTLGCEKVGRRPYELDWAGRVQDDHVPLVDFEDLRGWQVQGGGGGRAEFGRSREQQIWGRYTGKLTYQGSPQGAEFVLRPPAPLDIAGPFTAVNLWVWNDYRKWGKDRGQPMARMSLLLQTPQGRPVEVPFCRDLDWPGWYLLHARLNAEQRRAFAAGGRFLGLRLAGCRRQETRAVFLDNLSFYLDSLDMPGRPDYDVLPRPGVDLADGQDLGVHTGPDRLPFPTRPQTLLPVNLTDRYTTELLEDGSGYLFRYHGQDGLLEYRYQPQHGDLGDVSARWPGRSQTFHPMVDGGVRLKIDDRVEGLIQERFGTFIAKGPIARSPRKRQLLDCRRLGRTVVARWKVGQEGQWAIVEYVFRLWQKSLVIDVHCRGGQVGQVSLGRVIGTENPRLVEVPYWVGRPRVLVSGPPDKPLFMTAFIDHYRSGASRLYFENRPGDQGLYCSGGTYYLPRTDGKRNDCHERLFLTVSPRFEEVLPQIPNPPSRWRDTAAQYLVCYFAVQDRQADYAYWKKVARYGMNRVILLDWETCWRDGAESFTFRTRAAPGKGGDENLRRYIAKVQTLGFRYALYNNYVDLAPVNAWWDEDLLNRMPTGGWQQAWFRCYCPKPARVVKISRLLSAEMQRKFHPKAAGPDVHTAVSPWSRVDFDARMPGAGLLLTPFYAYGQLLLEQQEIFDGPVYSECGNNYYYSGLTTGSGACDHEYHFDRQPWLVDFYLRKMQPISCHWSLGYGKRSEQDCDRFLARTVAFGMPCGFLGGRRHGMDHLTIRGYFLLQQLQSSYCRARIRDIRYADLAGHLLDVSTAVAGGACRNNRIRLEYDNGLTVWVNGHHSRNWQTPHALLPPAGFYAQDQTGRLVVFSALADGRRADYVHAPAYDFIDGRGRWMQTPWGACDGQLIVLKKPDGQREVIPWSARRFAVALDRKPTGILALDRDGRPIGPATGWFRDRLFYIDPVPAAASYLLDF